MYNINGIDMNVVRTFTYEAESVYDPRHGTMCVELHSTDKARRYKLVVDAETFGTFTPSEN